LKIEALNRADEALEERIKELERKCAEFDGSKGRLSLDNSLNVHPELNHLFLMYEEDTLIAVLTMFMPSAAEAEIFAYTLPGHRMRGCFSRLLEEARKELEKYGSPRLLYTVDSRSEPGAKVMERLSCKLTFTEYLMSYREEAANLPEPAASQIKLRAAEHNDVEELSRLSMKIFSESFEDARSRILSTLNSADRIQYLALLDTRPIGLGAASFESAEASIYGLGISPEHRGKGYGRELLLSMISDIKRKGDYKITLEVDSRNDIAFELYRKNGFVIERAINYYREA